MALKNGLAYQRTLKYERVERARAEEDFNRIFTTKHMPDWNDRWLHRESFPGLYVPLYTGYCQPEEPDSPDTYRYIGRKR